MGPKSPCKLLRLGSRGNALIPVMMGFSVVAVTVTAISMLVVQSQRLAASSAARTDLQLLVAHLQSILGQEKSCRTALGGPETGYSPHTGTGVAPAWAQSAPGGLNGAVNIRLYQDFSGMNVFLDPANATAPFAQKHFGRLEITRLRMIRGPNVTSDGRTFRGYVYVQARKTANTEGSWFIDNSTGISTTNIPLNVRIDGTGRILTCNGLTLPGSASALPVCLSDEVLTGFGGNLTCIKVTCPPTLVRSRAFPNRANGAIQCIYAGGAMP